MVALSGDELTEMRMKVQSGELPADAIKRYLEDERKNVFGFDHKMKNGKPVEQGLGSPGNQTRNRIESYKRFNSHEPDFEKTVARMERELAAANERRAAERGDIR